MKMKSFRQVRTEQTNERMHTVTQKSTKNNKELLIQVFYDISIYFLYKEG